MANQATATERIFDYDTPIRITAPIAHILQMGSFEKTWLEAMAEMPEQPPTPSDPPPDPTPEQMTPENMNEVLRERNSSEEMKAWRRDMDELRAYFELRDERAFPITFNGAWLAAQFFEFFPQVWDGGLRYVVPDETELPPWARQIARHFKIDGLSTPEFEVFARAVEHVATWNDGSLEPGERSSWRQFWLEGRCWEDPALPGLASALFGGHSPERVKTVAAECQHLHGMTAEEYLAADYEQQLLDVRESGWTNFRTVDDLHRVMLVDGLEMEWIEELAIVFCEMGEHCEIEELEAPDYD